MMDSLKGLDLLACAVLILDRNGAIVYVNPAAEDLFESSSKVLAVPESETGFSK